jgi:hypothetical protein
MSACIRSRIELKRADFRIVFARSDRYLLLMKRACIWLLLISSLATPFATRAGTGRVIKVLPQFVDLKGRTSLSPSLYERDAYQVVLRDNPEKRSGVRFFVQWKTKGPVWQPLSLRIELRGVAQGNSPKQLVLEEPLENSASPLAHWVSASLEGWAYKEFGSVTAWRVTLWEGKDLLSEQKSFLW